MKTTDYFFEFAHFLKRNNITNKASLIFTLETFINSYFGTHKKIDREIIFSDIAYKNTTTDDEFFSALEKNEIGYLKNKGAAECTERSAMAQELLSLFGSEIYYSIGCIELNGRQEPHCFNIIKRKDDYAVLDYSCPVTVCDKNGNLKGHYPFIGLLSNDEFSEFLNNGVIKDFNDYEFIDGKRIPLNSKRLYVVGKYTIDKNNNKNEHDDDMIL